MEAFKQENALRADLQRYYGIDLDAAMRGAHSAAHIAALVAYLPSDCNLRRLNDKDAAWTLRDILLASILNSLNMLIYGLSGKKGRGKKPQMVGPSYITKNKLPARSMTVEELLAELNKPRG